MLILKYLLAPCAPRLADVTYNRDVFPALLRTLISLLQRGGGCTRVVMGYKQRDAAERTFWTASREMGVELEAVGRVGGVEDSAAVEIWMATGWKGITTA